MRTAISLLLLILVFSLHGQNKSAVSIYTSQQGLPSNVIRGIDEDTQGNLWISTDNGLCLFRDNTHLGKGITTIRQGAQTDDKHLKSNDLNMIYADRHEPLIWIATRSSGLDAYNYVSSTFTHYPITPSTNNKGRKGIYAANGLHDGSVTCITPDGENVLWLTSWMGGLSCMDKKAGRFYHFSTGNIPHLPSDSLWCILPLTRHGGYQQLSSTPIQTSRLLALGHTNHGLTIVDLKDFSCHNYPIIKVFKTQYKSEDGVRSIVSDTKGNLWLGTEKGLAFFDMKTRRAIEVGNINSLVSHLAIHNGILYISTRDMGLQTLSIKDFYGKGHSAKLHSLNTLSVSTCTMSFTDHYGNLWIGTQEEGLLLSRPHQLWFSNLQMPTGIKGNITSLLSLAADDIWVGTYQSGLYRWNPQTGKCKKIELTDNNGGKRIFVNGIARWQGRVAVATGQGLFIVKPKDNTFTCYSQRNSKLSSDYILSIATDHWGQLWCGTASGNIDILDRSLRIVQKIAKTSLGVQREIRYLCPLRKEGMVASTGNETILIPQDRNGNPLISTLQDSHIKTFNFNTINTIANDGEGNVLCFTPDGIYSILPSGISSVYPCEYSEPQANINVATPLPDGNILWYGNRQLGVMSQNETSITEDSSWLNIRNGITILLAIMAIVGTTLVWLRKTRSKATEHTDEPEQKVDETSGNATDSKQISAEDKQLIKRLEDIVANMESLESLNRDSLAKDMCMSTSTLYRRMKQALGLSPNEWIRIQRLERAKTLLNSGHNVSETANLVGLDSAYLARCYKERFGIYPSEVANN